MRSTKVILRIMKNVNFSVYRDIIAVRQAYLFDIGCFLMRIYMYMGTLGVVSMLSLSGHGALFSGSVSSMLAISTFFISPRTGKFMDERGQHHVILITSTIAMCGALSLLAVVAFQLPKELMYLAALLMGFVPSAPAIARTRWTYLIETKQIKGNVPELKSVYSYEGVIEDFAFMIGPALAISLSNMIVPIAGILAGCISFILGVFILLTQARSTEPQVGWKKHTDITAEEAPATKHRIALVDLPVIRVLFSMTLLVGLLFGCFDTTTITFAQSIGRPNVASVGVSVASLISMCASFTFGMLVFKSSLDKQVVVACIAIALGYVGMAFITDVPLFYFISFAGAVVYAPCFITINSFCEKAVPANRLTESLTWVSAGTTCGLAIGPTISGALIDFAGPTAGFYLGSIACVVLIIVALGSRKLLAKHH